MKTTTRWLVGGAMVLAAVALAVLGIIQVRSDSEATGHSFDDARQGISIDYPDDWRRVESDDPQVVLIATPNDRDSLFVRTVDLTVEVDASTLDGVREFTDELVTGGTDVDIVLGPRRIDLAGLPGWYYLYRFEDASSGETGIHAHYFLFDGDRMIVLVLQALPEDGFEAMAPTFDAIAGSLRVSPVSG